MVIHSGKKEEKEGSKEKQEKEKVMREAVVIGYGMVGKATALSFGIDKYFSRKESNITLEQASKCRYIFICLPTPTIDGKVFTDDIYAIIKQIEGYPNYYDRSIIIRSTVYPGFADYVCTTLNTDNVISNPEFLSESTWEEDAKRPWMVVIGGKNPKHVEKVKGLYVGRYKYMQPLITNNVTAELIKYTFNTFFATKVIFANEIYDYAQKAGANYETIKRAIEAIPWGSKNHFDVWYREKRGVRGRCLPKDTEAFANLTDSPFFKMLLDRNTRLV